MCGVKEICEEETDKLERHGDESVPDEGEKTADYETVDEDVIAVEGAGSQDRSSQYGGAESAAACSYVCDKVSIL